LNINIVMSKVFTDGRFLLVQYVPKDLETAEVFEKMRNELNG